MRLRQSVRAIAGTARAALPDILAVAGVIAALRGIVLFSVPAAWVVGGLALVGFAALLARREHTVAKKELP